jgi:transglutaminase/protease-like cytokinesis protein 3
MVPGTYLIRPGVLDMLMASFIKKLNNAYFKVEPAQIIASHIPFDYLWQFLNYPITNGGFMKAKPSQ